MAKLSDDELARVIVCHGPPRCTEGRPPCPFCYVIDADDKRSTDEHLKIMNRKH